MSHITRNYTFPILEDMKAKLLPICNNIFFGHRPASVKTQMKDFIVLSLNYTTRDKGAFQIGYYSIDLFVKNTSEGKENTKRLDEMLNGILELMPLVGEDKRYSTSTPYYTPVGDDNIGFTIWALRGTLIINTTDSYNFKISS